MVIVGWRVSGGIELPVGEKVRKSDGSKPLQCVDGAPCGSGKSSCDR